MKWESILTGRQLQDASNKLIQITEILCRRQHNLDTGGLMYGNVGVLLFLFYFWKWRGDEAVYKRAADMLTSIIKRINSGLINCDYQLTGLSFDSGISGTELCIKHLHQNAIIEGRIENMLGINDPVVYHQMIEYVQEPNMPHLLQALQISLYGVGRNSRLSKEYLNRLLIELTDRFCYSQTNLIETMHPDLIAKTRVIVEMIKQKYPDNPIAGTLSAYLSKSLIKRLSQYSENLFFDNLYSWYILLMSPQYSNLAIEILNNKSLEAIEYIDDLKMDSGLECGLLSVAHHFNHIYQFSKDIKFKNVACLCYSKLLQKSEIRGAEKIWQTASKGIWCQHDGLLNGLSGIGLSLLSAVSDIEPKWDECLFLSP